MRLQFQLLVAILFIPSLLVAQNSIVVTSPTDGGVGSLRQAVTDIDPGGTISFAIAEVALDSLLIIEKDLVIDGTPNDPRLRESDYNVANYLDPMFKILDVQVTFKSLTISSFYGGVVEQIGGSLILEDVSVDVYSEGPTFSFDQTEEVFFNRVSVSYNDLPLGGIGWGFLANSGNVTVLNSSIPSDIENSGANFLISDSYFGAARGYAQWATADFINNSGNYEIKRSFAGGGVKVGVVQYSGVGKITDSIISPDLNEIGPDGYAVICGSGQLTIWNSTLRGSFENPNYEYDYNIGGLKISENCNVDLYSTAILGSPGITDEASTVIENKFNLISDPSIDPYIDFAFAFFGGNPSHLSPLLDQGDCSLTGSVLDSRGSSRPVDLAQSNPSGGDGCDIGAVEAPNDNPSGFKLSTKVVLGGAWDGSAMTTALANNGQIPLQQPYDGIPDTQIDQAFLDAHPEIVDWVWVELRGYFGSSYLRGRRAALLTETGEIISKYGDELTFFAYPRDYHVVVGHRNHLPIMTADQYTFSNGSITQVDLSSDATDMYSDPDLASLGKIPFMDLGNGVIGLWPGDVNGNAEVKYSGGGNDRVLILDQAGGPTPFDFVTGYLNGDVNLDGRVSYSGAQNDRVEVLGGSGGPTSFDFRKSHVPRL